MSIKDIEPLLNHLSDLFAPSTSTSGVNPSSWLAAVTFSVLNHPEAVPIIFQYALNKVTEEDKLLLARKFRESMIISAVSGIPQMINSLSSLSNVMPEELVEKALLRGNMNISVSELLQIGRKRFDEIYGSAADSTGTNLRKAYPDLETYILLTYGYYTNIDLPDNIPILNPNEVSYAIIVSLISSNAPLQIAWHLDNALRNGAPLEEIKAVREIALKVAELCGVDRIIELPVGSNVFDK